MSGEQTLMRDPGVQNAFDAFKQSSSLQLAWADSIRFEKRPLIRDREIVLEDAVPLPAARTCLRYLGGVDLLELGEMACQHRQVPDLYEAYCRTHDARPASASARRPLAARRQWRADAPRTLIRSFLSRISAISSHDEFVAR